LIEVEEGGMFVEALKAAGAATRLLFRNRWTLLLLVLLYGGLLFAGYLFVSTREATVTQLLVTMISIIVAPVLFFALVTVSVDYANGLQVKKISADCLRIVAVSVPVIVVTGVVVYGLGKFDSQLTTVVALRYLLAGIVAPLLAIQLWIAASRDGLGPTWRGFRQSAIRALAPQSILVYGCGLVLFAVAPYFLIFHTMQIERAWLEVSVLIVRLSLSALLILFGWVTTVGTLSLLSKPTQC
jgi:hypothetical protein